MTVLGDSYSAGNGTLVDGYPADGSYRSPKNYGSVLTRRLNREFGDDTTFQTDVRAWSGAQITTGDHTIVSQADGMDPHTHVVLMTAGGNDLDSPPSSKTASLKECGQRPSVAALLMRHARRLMPR
ncbi:GDSL-type esterase/lipase family protein [Cutibacterium acnes]|uniref:GDSL-type esterase/lipase family protein n=1 Tax=Cutibacterium acnes TaxID=1747 RepID=UPI0020CC5688|nr:GDSL-type esterase/lipase family protein [Cutibacterium acnes]MCP9394788.1 GDSL-type esterase/lipase family protein [Cutibacterium acnes]MDP8533198.1 GDSL-type esterase/lipase family protein [Cutibacterium acnes]